MQQQWLHTLGNLTLTGYNAEYSDRAFVEKRDMVGGFSESPLSLNKKLGQVEVWNESAIEERAGRLAEQAVKVWGAPSLDSKVLAEYQPQKTAPVGAYSITDHPHLLSPTIGPLFEAFRQEVLALDACVSESFMKLYVAYKAETNFVDVVPQASRLRLSLNMAFADITDPQGRCRDVTNLGRWGNGDVEVELKSIDELPYVLGLVRQSFERQMGEGRGH